MQTNPTPSSAVAGPAAPTRSRTAERPSQKLIELALKMPDAQSVAVAGTFNNWDVKGIPMRKDALGGWRATVMVPPGRHEYRFVVDGQWVSDPNAKECVKNTFGTTNSVLRA